MSAGDIVTTLREAGVELRVVGGRLRYRAPRGVMTDELRHTVEQSRTELVAFLEVEDERAAPEAAALQPDRWHTLASSALTDLDVTDLDEALFLFALRKVKEAGDPEEVWTRFSRWWRERMPPNAFRLVDEACDDRVAFTSGRVETGSIMPGTRKISPDV